ncbi:MAG: hypothetical protein WKF84_30450 [Pyrinomonadaceae bacterium]
MTVEGVRVPVRVAADDVVSSTHAEMRGVEDGRRSVQIHEKSSSNPRGGHTIEMHVGKSEAAAQAARV